MSGVIQAISKNKTGAGGRQNILFFGVVPEKQREMNALSRPTIYLCTTASSNNICHTQAEQTNAQAYEFTCIEAIIN